MKRFYEMVDVRLVEEGFSVLLDDRPIKTPAKVALILPTHGMATAIAQEWDDQADKIDPATMPLMRYAATALDRVSAHRGAIIDEIAAYGTSDLLCHRADSPKDLVAWQEASWQPLLDWAADRFQALMIVTTGIMPLDQSPDALAALRAAVAAQDDMTLSGLHGITKITGSLVLALAVVEGRLDVEVAWEASQIDEVFQAQQWGEDEEAAERRTHLKAGVLDAARFLSLCAD